MINKIFVNSGFKPVFAYILLIISFILLSEYLFSKSEYAKYIYSFIALIVVGKLSDKSRSEFLNICFGDVLFKKIRILENLIIAFPLSYYS